MGPFCLQFGVLNNLSKKELYSQTLWLNYPEAS